MRGGKKEDYFGLDPQSSRRGQLRYGWRRTVEEAALQHGKIPSEIKWLAGNRAHWRCFVETLFIDSTFSYEFSPIRIGQSIR